MRVSVDTSFVFALLKVELLAEEHQRALDVLNRSESVHVPVVVYEELMRGVAAPEQQVTLSEALAQRTAALMQFLLFADVPPLTRQTASALAALWRQARSAGATSTTMDTFAAREAVHARAVMLTCDESQRSYIERAFGAERVEFFRHKVSE